MFNERSYTIFKRVDCGIIWYFSVGLFHINLAVDPPVPPSCLPSQPCSCSWSCWPASTAAAVERQNTRSPEYSPSEDDTESRLLDHHPESLAMASLKVSNVHLRAGQLNAAWRPFHNNNWVWIWLSYYKCTAPGNIQREREGKHGNMCRHSNLCIYI